MPALFESGFFGGNVPAWHELGKVIPEDVITSREALIVAGLDWEVVSLPVTIPIPGEDEPAVAKEHRAIVRTSDNSVLGIVGTKYRTQQNRDSFAFMDELLDGPEARSGEPLPKWHTAGSLEGGRKVWMLARIPKTIRIGGQSGEDIDPFMFFTTSHDGSSPVTIAATPVRIVCANTLAMAISGASRRYEVRHTEGASAKLSEARRILELTYTYYDRLETVASTMIEQRFTPRMWDALLDELIPIPDRGKSVRAHNNATTERYELDKVYRHAPNLANINGTAWGAFNAVAEFTDHHMKSRETKTSNQAENRAKRILSDTSLKDKAQKAIGELVTAAS